MGHPSQDDLAAYALGALDRGEERSVTKHIGRCERCATALRERYAAAVAVLAESVEQVEPPPELRQSLMATVREEAAADAGEGLGRRRAPRPTGVRGFLLRPAAGLAAVALGAAGVAGYLVAEGGQGEDAETVPITSAQGSAGGELVLEDCSATLEMHGMEQLAKGSVYQVWVADSAGIKPSAAFGPRSDGTATAAVPEASGEIERLMITREPMAGRKTPTPDALVFDAQIN